LASLNNLSVNISEKKKNFLFLFSLCDEHFNNQNNFFSQWNNSIYIKGFDGTINANKEPLFLGV